MPEPDALAITNQAASGRSHQTQIGGVAGEGKMLCPSCEARFPEQLRECPRDGTALVEVDGIVGSILSGTYFVRRMLGEGAMGKVYEARHTRIPAKRFAVKMLHPEYLREPQILARFAREAEAAATINHPHCVIIVDVDRTADGRPFLVSELLEGKQLGEHLEAVRKMPVAAAVRVAVQVAEALAAAHARGIVHRDVKPENVFLTGDLAAPIAKVLDFGISRLDRREGQQLTMAGAVIGTPSFMPPEQARGDRVDHRADIYAVGAILYTALTGRPPFDAETPAMIVLAVLNEEPPRPRTLDPTIPEALEGVILRAMARDPEKRYATMDELCKALASLDTSPPASSRMMLGRPMQVTLPDGTTIPERSVDWLTTHARPALAVLVAAAFGWAFAALASAIASIVRAAHGDNETLGWGASTLVTALVLGALGWPAFLAARRIRGLWDEPLLTADLVRRAAPPVICAILAYGAVSAAVRLLETTMIGRHAPWAGWDVLLLLAGVAGGAVPFVPRGNEAPKSARRVA